MTKCDQLIHPSVCGERITPSGMRIGQVVGGMMSPAGTLEEEKQGEVHQRVCLQRLICTNILWKTSTSKSPTVFPDNSPGSLKEEDSTSNVSSGVCTWPRLASSSQTGIVSGTRILPWKPQTQDTRRCGNRAASQPHILEAGKATNFIYRCALNLYLLIYMSEKVDKNWKFKSLPLRSALGKRQKSSGLQYYTGDPSQQSIAWEGNSPTVHLFVDMIIKTKMSDKLWNLNRINEFITQDPRKYNQNIKISCTP